MSIWEIYKKTCENSEETPKGYRQFHRLLEPMIKNGILSTERKSHGSTRGMANLLYLGEDYEIIAPIVLEGMKGI